MNTNTRITLKNIKYFAAGSQETLCYVAAVYFDGKKVGDAENDGHGGNTMVRYDSKDQRTVVQAYCASLDPATYRLPAFSFSRTRVKTDEEICDDLVTDWLLARDLKRMLATRLVYTKPDVHGIYETNKAKSKAILDQWLSNPEQVKAKLKADKLLNVLPFDEALSVFKAAA